MKVIRNKNKTKEELQEEYDRDQILKYWINKKDNTEFNDKFECERYVTLTDQERHNLVLLKIFRNFQWYVEKSKFETGQSFG